MESLFTATAGSRRSDRLSIAFPLEIAAVDISGSPFSEKTTTTTVSRFGCCLPVSHALRTDQKVLLRRFGMDETAIGRVVAPMGTHPDGQLYGIETRNSCEGLWGIKFSSSFHEKLLDSVQDGIYFVNRDRKITYWNESAERLSGYSAYEVIGMHCFENLLGHSDEQGSPLCASGCPLSQVMADGHPRRMDLYLRHKDGYLVAVAVRAMPLRNQAGAIIGAVAVFSHSGSAKTAPPQAFELQQLSFRDALTGLHNRQCSEMKVEQALEEHRKHGRPFGLLLSGLDNFQRLNETLARDHGDALLKAVAQNLVQGFRALDIVGRWDAESFLILMPHLHATELGDMAERCRVLTSSSSVAAEGSRISATASIGATMLSHLDSAESLLQRADELMKQSKKSGGDRTTAG